MLLAIDTSGPFCSVALDCGSKVSSISEELGRGHAERLMPMIEDLLTQNSTGFEDLTAIATTTGPGSFTGLRVGLAAARGLSLALNCPCHGVSVFEAFAWQIKQPLTVAIDAKRDQIWMQMFNPVALPLAANQNDALEMIPLEIHHLIGSAAPYLKALDNRFSIISDAPSPPIESVAQIARTRNADERHPSPLYLRAPDAKPQTQQAAT